MKINMSCKEEYNTHGKEIMSHSMMQSNFQNFMLKSSSARKGKQEGPHMDATTGPSLSEENFPMAEGTQSKDKNSTVRIMEIQIQQREKKIWTLARQFYRLIQHEWMDMDDQLYRVLQSISNIDQRIPMFLRFRNQFSIDAKISSNSLSSLSSSTSLHWIQYGFTNETYFPRNNFDPQHKDIDSLDKCRSGSRIEFYGDSTNDTITNIGQSDIELALTHDLMQREKMISSIRTLLSNLSDCQDHLGRVLNDAIQYAYDSWTHMNFVYKDTLHGEDDTQDSSRTFYASLLEKKQRLDSTTTRMNNTMNDVFIMLSNELYRKLNMGGHILERMISTFQEDVDLNMDVIQGKNIQGKYHPQKSELDEISHDVFIAQCLEKWPRSSNYSCLDVALIHEQIQTIL